MQHSTLPLVRLRTLLSPSACTKRRATMASIPSSVKSADGYSGFSLEVSIPFQLSVVLFAVAISVQCCHPPSV